MKVLRILFKPLMNEYGGIFDIFRKRPKVNVTPDIPFPNQNDLHFTRPLRELAEAGIKAAGGDRSISGIGFGDDFLSRATNPAVQDRMRRLREDEIPLISNQQSARGLGRSTLATNQIARQSRLAQGDIDQLLANFFVLNEQQRKKDITERLGIATGLQSQQAALKTQAASASERLANATAAQQLNRDQSVRGDINDFGNAVLAAAAGGMSGFQTSGASTVGGGLTTGLTLPNGTPITTFGPNNIPNLDSIPLSTKTRTIQGASNASSTSDLMKFLKQAFQGG